MRMESNCHHIHLQSGSLSIRHLPFIVAIRNQGIPIVSASSLPDQNGYIVCKHLAITSITIKLITRYWGVVLWRPRARVYDIVPARSESGYFDSLS